MIQKVYKFRTHEKIEIVNVTKIVIDFAKEESLVPVGCVHVFSPHTTAALILNEDEAGLKEDIIKLANLLTNHMTDFGHNRVDHNAVAHLTQILYGHHVFVPIRDGCPLLGDWQALLFLELDGPRERRLILTVT